MLNQLNASKSKIKYVCVCGYYFKSIFFFSEINIYLTVLKPSVYVCVCVFVCLFSFFFTTILLCGLVFGVRRGGRHSQ